MNKIEIIKELAEKKTIETLIQNIVKTSIDKDDTLKDLSQDLYVDLLNKDDKKIEGLYNNGQLLFFLTKAIYNNLYSVNSPYYYKYKRFQNKSEELKNINIVDGDK